VAWLASLLKNRKLRLLDIFTRDRERRVSNDSRGGQAPCLTNDSDLIFGTCLLDEFGDLRREA